MKNRLLRVALLAGMIGLFFMMECHITRAADYNTDPTPQGIGRDMDNMGLRVVGISYAVDGGLREFSFDVYNDRDGKWEYSHTKINDTHNVANATNVDNASAYITVFNNSNSSNGKHYQVHAARLRQSLGDFSVVTNTYYKGKLQRRRKEYSFLPSSSSNSIIANNDFSVAGFSAEENSYNYNFYRPRALDAQTEVAVQAGEGTLENGGVAYYTEDGYYIKELPTVSLQKPGNSVFFLGWYDAREGGNQIQAGTWCASGTTLYARWNIVPVSCNVTCYDICGNSPSGKVLGEHSWKADFGTSVSGAMKGDSTEKNAYYKGYTYHNDTTAVVSDTGTTVYRYFSEHQYRISFEGNGATNGNMEMLNHCTYTGQVTLTGNCFQKELCVTLDVNGENATCDTGKVYLNQRFLGWATSPEGQVKYSDGASVTGLTDSEETVTLYAVWSDERLTVKEKPQRMGYEFAGWAMTSEAETGLTQFSVNEDMTLFAVWKPGTAAYHVEYYKEKTDGRYELESSYAFEDSVNKTVEITAEENRYLGYFLDRHSSIVSGTVRPDGSLILSVFYTRNKNEVSYDINGGEKTVLPETVEKKFEEELTIWDETALKKTGYTFVGWSQEPDGKNQVYAPGEKIKMPNHKVVLYAVWKADSYEVRFDGNGAGQGESPKTIHAAFDEKLQLPACRAEKAGHEFTEWNTKADGTGVSYTCDGKVQNLCKPGEKSITLYAQWKPLSFEITYLSNKISGMGVVKGIVENTTYSYVKPSYASKEIYYADGYQFMGWNTKADGTGIMFAAGEEITGKLTSKKESVLYAVWRLAENTGFQVTITLEGTDRPFDTLQCYGKTGEKVSAALERIYKKSLDGEEAEYFYQGYQVVNKDELEKIIQGDHSTKCNMIVKKRRCYIDYGIFNQDIFSSTSKETDYAYQENVALKEKLEYLGKERPVARYIDQSGKVYYPGESISLKKNLTLIPQFKITMHGQDGADAKEDFCSWGKSYTLPGLKKAGYEFLGWYTEDGTLVGKEKDVISGIENKELFAKWSDPLHYRITFDIDDQVLRILENRISKYQYLTETALPGKNQVAVLADDREFVGWYVSDDPEQKIIDKIASGTYGDIILKAKLVKKEILPPGNGDQVGDDNKNPGKPDDGQENNKKPDKKPDQSVDITKNPDIFSENQNPNPSVSQDKAGKNLKKGMVFWKNKIKYQIISTKNGKTKVKVTGNHYKKKLLRIPAKITYKKQHCQVTAIGRKAFRKNKYIRKAVVPNTVRTVGSQAFANMKKLTEIRFGKNVKIIGKKMCYKDSSLRKVSFKSKKLQKTGKNAFQGCKKLHKIGGLKKQGRKLLKK